MVLTPDQLALRREAARRQTTRTPSTSTSAPTERKKRLTQEEEELRQKAAEEQWKKIKERRENSFSTPTEWKKRLTEEEVNLRQKAAYEQREKVEEIRKKRIQEAKRKSTTEPVEEEEDQEGFIAEEPVAKSRKIEGGNIENSMPKASNTDNQPRSNSSYPNHFLLRDREEPTNQEPKTSPKTPYKMMPLIEKQQRKSK